MQTIDINGVSYKLKEEEVVKQRRIPRYFYPYVLMAQTLLAPEIKHKERPDVNIIEEFRLIQLKKSKLSKSQRDWVEFQFHKHFEKV